MTNYQKHCRKCGKPFKHDHLKKICKECYSKKHKKIATINQWENEEKLKEYWKKKTGTLKTQIETIPKWDNDTYIPHTKEPCSTCKQPHWQNEKNKHEYTKEYYVKGITTESIPELLKEYEKTKNKKDFLERRGLI